MFQTEGSERSDRLNRVVAGYLAFIGGYVNSTGFVLLGAFTSHVTGNVSRGALDLAVGHLAGAVSTIALVVSFFFGALAASLLLESRRFATTSRRYGMALAVEGVLLGVFAFTHASGFVLCVAMGLQNSLVTRLSGAIVRTTHLTGVVTDLGIEVARWWHWARSRDAESRPSTAKFALLGTIAVTFILGAIIGSAMTTVFGRLGLLLPIVGLAAGATYARRR